MDIIYHALVGVAISKSLGGKYEAAAAICAMLPDLIGTTPLYYFRSPYLSQTSAKDFLTHMIHATTSEKFTNTVEKIAYRTTHSLVTALLFSLLMYLLFPAAWIILSLSWLSHVLIDIPTHSGDFATQLLYPISQVHIQAKNWSTKPKVFILLWGILLAILALQYLYH